MCSLHKLKQEQVSSCSLDFVACFYIFEISKIYSNWYRYSIPSTAITERRDALRTRRWLTGRDWRDNSSHTKLKWKCGPAVSLTKILYRVKVLTPLPLELSLRSSARCLEKRRRELTKIGRLALLLGSSSPNAKYAVFGYSKNKFSANFSFQAAFCCRYGPPFSLSLAVFK